MLMPSALFSLLLVPVASLLVTSAVFTIIGIGKPRFIK